MRRWLSDEEYERYRASHEWALLKREVRERSGGVCERCRRQPALRCHHLTYIRMGCELLEDLLDECEECHAYLHVQTDIDPDKATAGPS